MNIRVSKRAGRPADMMNDRFYAMLCVTSASNCLSVTPSISAELFCLAIRCWMELACAKTGNVRMELSNETDVSCCCTSMSNALRL